MREFEVTILDKAGAVLRRFLSVAFSRGAALRAAAEAAGETPRAAGYAVEEC